MRHYHDPQPALRNAVAQLLEETCGYDDAKSYIKDVADEIGVSEEAVLKELKRQCGQE